MNITEKYRSNGGFENSNLNVKYENLVDIQFLYFQPMTTSLLQKEDVSVADIKVRNFKKKHWHQRCQKRKLKI